MVASTRGTNSTTGAGGVGCAPRGLSLEQRGGAPEWARRPSGANPTAAGDEKRMNALKSCIYFVFFILICFQLLSACKTDSRMLLQDKLQFEKKREFVFGKYKLINIPSRQESSEYIVFSNSSDSSVVKIKHLLMADYDSTDEVFVYCTKNDTDNNIYLVCLNNYETQQIDVRYLGPSICFNGGRFYVLFPDKRIYRMEGGAKVVSITNDNKIVSKLESRNNKIYYLYKNDNDNLGIGRVVIHIQNGESFDQQMGIEFPVNDESDAYTPHCGYFIKVSKNEKYATISMPNRIVLVDIQNNAIVLDKRIKGLPLIQAVDDDGRCKMKIINDISEDDSIILNKEFQQSVFHWVILDNGLKIIDLHTLN